MGSYKYRKSENFCVTRNLFRDAIVSCRRSHIYIYIFYKATGRRNQPTGPMTLVKLIQHIKRRQTLANKVSGPMCLGFELG